MPVGRLSRLMCTVGLTRGKGEARVNVLSLNHQDDDFPGRGGNVLTGCQQVQENAKLGVLI